MKINNFEQYLETIYSESVNCTENDSLDDDFQDDFDFWFSGLDADDLVKYANMYGRYMLLQGQAQGLMKGCGIAQEAISKL